MAVIDVTAQQVSRRVPLPACKEPMGLAHDPQFDLTISACSSCVAGFLSAQTGVLAGQVDIGKGCDAALLDEVKRQEPFLHRWTARHYGDCRAVDSGAPRHAYTAGMSDRLRQSLRRHLMSLAGEARSRCDAIYRSTILPAIGVDWHRAGDPCSCGPAVPARTHQRARHSCCGGKFLPIPLKWRAEPGRLEYRKLSCH
jgi:hypothetical protein